MDLEKKFVLLDRTSFIAVWCSVLGREPEGEEYIQKQLKLHKGKSVLEYANELKKSQEYQDSLNLYCETKVHKEDSAVSDIIDPIGYCQDLFKKNKVGVINWHGGFTQNIQRIYNNVVIIDKFSSPEQVAALELDVLVNHHDVSKNKSYGDINYIALNYWTITKEHVRIWNEDPQCVGIIDFSMILKIRYPNLFKPVRFLKPKYKDLNIYKNKGSKIITLIQNYEQRFQESFNISSEITPYICQGVYDVDALSDAKWLLHIRPRGFVCNAVMRALGSGVPVIMDTETWHNGFFGAHVRHNDNAIVLPTNKIKEFLDNCPDSLYERIKNNCVRYAERDKAEFDLN